MSRETPKFVGKGWGSETHFANSPLYCGKLLTFNKGKKCSFHYHKLKTEHFYLHKGQITLRVSNGDDLGKAEVLTLLPGDVFFVPPGLRHQMHAEEDSELFEFSTQDFPEDSYRIIKGD